MTNGRGAGMASFMTKKKKYKFQVDVCLEELLEVPFVSAVLFAKLRLLDGGNFQDHSTREEVKDHKVKWGAKFSFPCKMLANASTGVLERSILRISVRKECKGGRSFTKLGFVDLNLAEYAGAGVTYKKALLEGYDARRRQDNSMLKFSIAMNMLSGDILFKVPTSVNTTSENPASESRSEDFSSGSLGGSIASGSSGFGSLPKKRPALLSSDLVIGHTLIENNYPVTVANDNNEQLTQCNQDFIDELAVCETGHSRNSSNTSQLSKASGYSSIHSHSHSRQSSSGDSGHIRSLLFQYGLRKANLSNTFLLNTKPFTRFNTYPNHIIKIPNTVHSPLLDNENDSIFSTPQAIIENSPNNFEKSIYYTPKGYQTQISDISNYDDYKTPNETFDDDNLLEKSLPGVVIQRKKTLSSNDIINRISEPINQINNNQFKINEENILRSKSEFEIPRVPSPITKKNSFHNFFLRSDSLSSFLTPRPKRKNLLNNESTPIHKISELPPLSSINTNNHTNIINYKNIINHPTKKINYLPEKRTTSLCSLQSASASGNGNYLVVFNDQRVLSHRKLLEGSSGVKLTPLAISPDELTTTTTTTTTIIENTSSTFTTIDNASNIRRLSITTNPSSSSLVLSETGSLDRAKAAYERRKKNQLIDGDVNNIVSGGVGVGVGVGVSGSGSGVVGNVPIQSSIVSNASVPGRVEITRVNPDDLIEELLKNTNLDQADDSAETSGLQLFIAKDGTAAVGNHEVKSQMTTGGQIFKQVVMDDNR